MCRIYKRFDSVKAFSDYLDGGKTQSIFEGYEWSSKGGYSFCKSKNFAEANNLMLYGDRNLLKRIEEAGVYTTRVEIKKYVEHKKIISSVVGAAANVPAFLAGSPNSMMRYSSTKVKQRVVNVGYNSAVYGGVNPDDIISAGARLISALMILEAKGVKANVFCLDLDRADGGYVSYSIKIKASGQKFDVLRMAYFLAHPSMNRRHKFRFTEVTEGVSRGFVSGYGCPVSNDDEILKHFEAQKLHLDAAFNHESLNSLSVEEVVEKILGKK